MRVFIRTIALVFFVFACLSSFAQKSQDSIEVVKTFKQIISLCKNVDFSDPFVQRLGTFYKAAPYIIYQGKNEKRKWRDFANYSKAEDKKGVDEVCFHINNTVNQDSAYTITGYFTQNESEGTWHILTINYIRKEKQKSAAFAFLKIGNRFGLGDID